MATYWSPDAGVKELFVLDDDTKLGINPIIVDRLGGIVKAGLNVWVGGTNAIPVVILIGAVKPVKEVGTK